MSNAAQDSRNQGQKRRRRSRGGQNRNKNRNQDRRDQTPKAEEFRLQGSRPARKYSPPKLTFWQKILKAIGLYKEPVRPPRPERKPDVSKQHQSPEPKVKSNTRNARTGEGQQQERREKGNREGREGGREGGRNREGNRSRGGDANTVESSRVYVGNLSYDVSESDLIDLFKGVGGVRNVEIVYNRTTHRSKGYGFVEMLHVDEAKRAVEVLHDQHFMGRKLIVSGAKSKGQDEREDKEERSERPARQPKAETPAAQAAAAAVAAPAAVAPVETVTPLQEAAPALVQEIAQEPEVKEIVAAAVENTEATGAPEVIVDAVEHQVTAAVEEQPSEEKQA